MQKFFISKGHIAESERPDTEDSFIEIYLPNNCQSCNRRVVIYYAGSKSNSGSMMIGVCAHFGTWEGLYNNRIINPSNTLEPVVASQIIDPIDDGAKCSGSCGLWYSMAAPNQPNNTFKCWSCRNRGW